MARRSVASNGAQSLTTSEVALIEAIAAAAENRTTLTREEAGTLAGYGKGEVARVQASRALARPQVRSALIERAQQVIAADALHAAHVLRHVRDTGGRDRLPAAIETMKLAGMGQQEGGSSGPAIALQLIIGGAAGNVFSARLAQSPQAIDNAQHSKQHNIHYGNDQRTVAGSQRQAKAARDPSPGPKRKAKAEGGRGQKRPARAPARPRHTISPPPGDVSEGETS